MANDVTVNPLYFDTAGATSAVAYSIIINSIVWDSGDSGAAGDNLVLHDAASGDVVFQATLDANKQTVIWTPAKPFPVTGLYLTTLDNGVVLVYFA